VLAFNKLQAENVTAKVRKKSKTVAF